MFAFRFLPTFCPEFKDVPLDLTSEQQEAGKSKGANRRLEPVMWMLAWDGYALAAAVLNQVLLAWQVV